MNNLPPTKLIAIYQYIMLLGEVVCIAKVVCIAIGLILPILEEGEANYTYIPQGGVKAVVYTDVLQTLLMFFGILVVVIICCQDLGGVSKVMDIARQGQRLQFFK